jgi:hypothetical protein
MTITLEHLLDVCGCLVQAVSSDTIDLGPGQKPSLRCAKQALHAKLQVRCSLHLVGAASYL